MRQFLHIVSLSILIAGCSNNSATTSGKLRTAAAEKNANDSSNADDADFNTTGDVNVDTLGMAEFLAFKAAEAAKHKRSNSVQTNSASNPNEINVDTLGWAEFKRLKAETARQAYADSIRREEIIAKSKKQPTSQNSGTSKTEKVAKQSEAKAENTTPDQTQVATSQSPNVQKKKGLSNKTKGAVIGAATGAAAGAVINKKNRKAGGIIGGIVGAAAGYGIGRHKDKKDTVENKKDTLEKKNDEDHQ